LNKKTVVCIEAGGWGYWNRFDTHFRDNLGAVAREASEENNDTPAKAPIPADGERHTRRREAN
jgi:hypothetical protein